MGKVRLGLLLGCPAPSTYLMLPPLHYSDARESSFIEESSFVRNPLNSRLAPQPSRDHVRESHPTESLKGVSLEIQEALMLEDLLSVLMVTFIFFDALLRCYVAYIDITGHTRDVYLFEHGRTIQSTGLGIRRIQSPR